MSANPLRSTAREALERAEKATLGPWAPEFDREDTYGPRFIRGVVCRANGTDLPWVVRFDDDYGTDQCADARFIAAARTDVPTLARAVLSQADTIDELRAEVERLRAENERLRQSNPLTFRLAADYVRIELDDDGTEHECKCVNEDSQSAEDVLESERQDVAETVAGMVGEEPSTIRDLMAALEQSLAEAKRRRQ